MPKSGTATNTHNASAAVVESDPVAGEIQPDQGLAEGFNGKYFLKGTIHELGQPE
jgi:hypothetical protein